MLPNSYLDLVSKRSWRGHMGIYLCLSSFCILLLLSVKPLLEGEQSAVREAEVMLHCAASTDTLPLRG